MSFQAYLDTIKAKTGKSPEDFIALAKQKGLLAPGVKAGEIVAWLRKDFGLGQGHAMAIVATFRRATGPSKSIADKVDEHFRGERSHWRSGYEGLIGRLRKFGDDVTIVPTSSYLSVLKTRKKFAVIQITSERMDIGIKLAGVKATARLETAGSWNSMVTHRVRVTQPKQIDATLIAWLRQAYDAI